MKVSIISTGEELLHGRTIDTNAAFLAAGVEPYGFRVHRLLVLGDDGAALADELRRCAQDSGLTLVTGGLGPTADDRTRWAVAEAAGRGLTPDEPSRRHVAERLRGHGLEASEAQLTQAMFPAGSVVFPNPRGTARGFACPVGESWVVAMPGVPAEMRGMFPESILPFLLQELAPGGCFRVESVHLFPISESQADERLRDLTAPGRNPSLGITTRDGVISVSVSAHADDEQRAEGLLRADLELLRERFGELLFGMGDATLASVLGRELEQQGLTVGVAESVTGGLIGHMLVEVPGISRVFLADVVAYGNEAKVGQLGVPPQQLGAHGAVSPQVAESMARAICRRVDCDVGLSTTGVAGPTGGSKQKPVGLVYVGVALGGAAKAVRLDLRGDRQRIRDRAAKHALNLARIALVRGVDSL